MKNKSARVLGVVITLMLIVSSIVAIPSTASAGSQAWSTVALPGSTGQVVNASDITKVVVTSNAIYASVVAEAGTTAGRYTLRKSTDGGKTWSTMGGTTFAPALGVWIVDIVASKQSVNSIYVAVSDGAGVDQVYVSTNGGTSFAAPYNVPIGAGTGITAMDVTYFGTAHIIAVANDDAAGTGNNIFLLDETPAVPAWVAYGNAMTRVSALGFSPNYATDRLLYAVGDDGTDAYVSRKAAAGVWSAIAAANTILDSTGASAGAIAPAAPQAGAIIRFPDDFNSVSNNEVFVGLNGSAIDDVYDLNFVVAPFDLQCTSSTVATPVASMVLTGTAGAATIVVGKSSATTSVVRRSTNSGVSWSGASKPPTGGETGLGTSAFVAFAADFATTSTVFAGTTGENPFVAGAPDLVTSDESAFSISTDSGANFNSVSLVDTDFDSIDSLIPGGTTTDLYVVTNSSNAVPVASLWRTANNTTGGNWVRIFAKPNDAAGTRPWMVVGASPAYDTDKTIWVGIDDVTASTFALAWKSANANGIASMTAARSTVPSTTGDVTTIAVASPTSVFFGDTAGDVIRTTNGGNFFLVTASGATSVNSLDLAPNYPTVDDLVVGGITGDGVYLSKDAGVTFSALATGAVFTGNIYAHFDPRYDASANTAVFAGDDAGSVYRYVNSTDGWAIRDAAVALVTGLEILAGPTGQQPALYAADYAAAGLGVERSINPDGSTLASRAFASTGGTTSVLPAAATLGDDTTGVVGVARRGLWAQKTGTVANLWVLDTSGAPGAEVIRTYTDNLLVQPALTSPATGANIASQTTVTVTYPAVTGATKYDVETRNTGVAGSVFAVAVGATTFTSVQLVGLTAGATYEWRIRATSPDSSYYSPVQTFTLQLGQVAPPGNPSIGPGGTINVTPAPGALAQSTRPLLTWNASATATGYELVISKNADMSAPVVNLAGATALGATVTNYQPATALDANTTYFWQVRAVAGTTAGSWSPVFAFQTAPAAVTTTTAPPVVITTVTQPPATTTIITTVVTQPPQTTVTFTQPPATTITNTVVVPPAAAQATPAWVWAIIAIGGILLIVVIVLIARTRKV